MENKFTNGIWRLDVFVDRNEVEHITVVSPTEMKTICQISRYDKVIVPESEYQANADLISAAPDLLEALINAKALLQCLGVTTNNEIGGKEMQSIFDAINKATGK